jgi:RNA polymerase sigma-70 factor (ECF subfamily)
MLSRKDFEGRSGEYTWLCSIAKNLCNDYFRAEVRKADFPEEEIESKDRVDVIQRETSFEIHRILHEMREPYKEVFELRVFGELSFSEIARIFHKTESWARVTYHRARLKIKERMDKK